MWSTFIASAIAASVFLSAVNLASHLNKITDFRHSHALQRTAPSALPNSEPSFDGTPAGGDKAMF